MTTPIICNKKYNFGFIYYTKRNFFKIGHKLDFKSAKYYSDGNIYI